MQRIRCRRAERALTTAVVLGLVTSLWHLVPLVKMGHSALWIAWWTVWSVPLRIFILWVYNNTAKSLFAAIVMHATINLSSSSPFIPRVGSHWDLLILAVLTWIVAIVLVGVWGRTLRRGATHVREGSSASDCGGAVSGRVTPAGPGAQNFFPAAA